MADGVLSTARMVLRTSATPRLSCRLCSQDRIPWTLTVWRLPSVEEPSRRKRLFSPSQQNMFLLRWLDCNSIFSLFHCITAQVCLAGGRREPLLCARCLRRGRRDDCAWTTPASRLFRSARLRLPCINPNNGARCLHGSVVLFGGGLRDNERPAPQRLEAGLSLASLSHSPRVRVGSIQVSKCRFNVVGGYQDTSTLSACLPLWHVQIYLGQSRIKLTSPNLKWQYREPGYIPNHTRRLDECASHPPCCAFVGTPLSSSVSNGLQDGTSSRARPAPRRVYPGHVRIDSLVTAKYRVYAQCCMRTTLASPI